MTAAVFSNHRVISSPFQYFNSRERALTNAGPASSSKSTPQPGMTDGSLPVAESSTGPFGRMRSSIEQSLRAATRSKKSPSPDADEFATITARPAKGKGKEKEVPVPVPKPKESSKSNMLLSKVTFGRAGRESLSPSPNLPAPVKKDASDVVRQAGFTSFVAPSLRGASMSSPSLHLSSQAAPSPKSRPPIPASSSSPTANILTTHSRNRHSRSSAQSSSREISTPVQLGSRRDTPLSKSPSSSRPTTRHRSTQSVPLVLSNQLPTSPVGRAQATRTPEPSSPHRKGSELPSPPATPSPIPPSPSSPSQFSYSSRRAAASSGHIPLNTSPIAPRASSPSRTRPTRVITPSQRSLLSTSNLPPTPSPTQSARRPSVDSPSRSGLEKRRPSVDSPRRPSIDSPRRPSVESPRRASVDGPRPGEIYSRVESPSPRPRPVSPSRRNYAQNRYLNMSTTSLTGPPNPEYRELIRTATAMLCKELIKKPPHLSKNESGAKDWEGVEDRMNSLRRAERVWSKTAVSPSSPTSSGFSSAEERERRLFCDALRDGFVLCHLLNKMRAGFIVKPDPREEKVVRLSNVNKFLAACSSYGLHESDLFQLDDLIEGTGESLARVAKTIIALIKYVETPHYEKPKFISGGEGKRPAPIAIPPRHTRVDSPPLRASAPSPTALPPRVASSASPGRRRYSPPSGLPPVYSHKDVFLEDSGDETEGPERPALILSPPPRSPLRARPTKRNGDNRHQAITPPSPLSSSFPNSSSLHDSYAMRQSVASSALTESTAVTDVSSILDYGRSRTNSNGYSKFGTIRTMTTDVTSEAPSLSRNEGNAIADELARKRLPETPTKAHRENKLSDAAEVMRVVEEGDESVASSRSGGKNREGRITTDRDQLTPSKPEKTNAIHLRKGKWPDDFMDVFRGQSPVRVISPDLLACLEDETASSAVSTSSAISASPVSRTPPRKLAIVEGTQRNENQGPLPRRPTHRARQTADAPILLPRDNFQRRESSPDTSVSPSGRGLLRRPSTRPSISSRTAVAIQPKLDDSLDSPGPVPIPFPRTTSGEYSNLEVVQNDRLRLHRGRFQSDIDSSSARRRTRPTSIDGLAVIPDRRSRIESMGHLGNNDKNASASDLLSTPRDSVDGSAVRKTLVVREDGKPSVHFQLGNCIGRGQFGSVYRALNLNSGQMVAVKRIRLEGLKEDEVTTLMREVDLMKSLSHPSIVKYEGMERDKDTLSIVLEYAENGSLGQTLKAFGKLNERLVANYVVKILEGLHYLHENDVVHCDLKAANILTTKTGNVKLSDFGVSLNLRAMERDQKDVAGTPNWMAPEVIELKGASTKSDIWSLGCTVIELLTGRPPYAEITNSMSVMFRIVEDPTPPLPDDCSPLLEDFLHQCFHKDPTKRPSAELLFEHQWLKKNWGLHQELRPQDSIPFLRRVSADLHKQRSHVMKLLSQGETPESPSQAMAQSPSAPSPVVGRRPSDLSTSVLGGDNDISVREHSFVKTTFSKPMICRVCLLNVKKSAVLCAQCSLIAHAKCTPDAPPTCDLRAQLLLYAKFAEAGSPTSLYSNPADGLVKTPVAPASDVPYISHSPRTSIDGAASPIPPLPPAKAYAPTAYKLMGAFKRSRSNLTNDTVTKASSSQEKAETVTNNKGRSGASKSSRHERPHSTTSNNTEPNSLRSAATGAGSTSSRYDRKSAPSSSGQSTSSPLAEPTSTSSKLTTQSTADTVDTMEYGEISYTEAIPGSLPMETRRHWKKDSNCTIQ